MISNWQSRSLGYCKGIFATRLYRDLGTRSVVRAKGRVQLKVRLGLLGQHVVSDDTAGAGREHVEHLAIVGERHARRFTPDGYGCSEVPGLGRQRFD